MDKHEPIHQNVEDGHLSSRHDGNPVSIDHVRYDGYDYDRKSGVRTRIRQGHSEYEHRMKRDAENGKKYVYVMFDLSCRNCADKMTDRMAEEFTEKLAKHMGMSQSLFLEVSGSGNIVTFGISQNEHNLQPSDMAEKISVSKSDVQRVTGFVIIKVGTSNKSSSEMMSDSEETRILSGILALIVYTAVSVIIVTILVSAVIFFVRKRISGKRMNGFPKTIYLYRVADSHQYEDLCRTHYQEVSKGQLGTTGTTEEKPNVPKLHPGLPVKCDEEPAVGHMDVKIGHLVLSYLEQYQTNANRIDCEWQELCNYQPEECSVDVASRPENKEKNRYHDITPYDHSRVVLEISNNKANSDYINASYIFSDNPWKSLYVATQGPLATTVYDFWQMVWETGCTTIVMLTECFSIGQPQCHQYWPDDGSATYHIYEVHHASEHLLFHDYVVRDFYLKNLKTSESRTVTQFHFRTWPSLGVPQHTVPLLEFRRRVNRSFSGQDSPIIVHGSAGIGRTGTYILIDMVLRGIEKAGSKVKQIDLAATVEHLRDQRMQMVKTKVCWSVPECIHLFRLFTVRHSL
jgi:receptor-type tyrosine-protein phosphatase N